MEDTESKKKYMELKMLDDQLNQVQKQIMAFDNQVAELENIRESLDELKKVKPGTEILVPVSNGMFVRAEIKESSSLLVNVGQDTVVEKDIPSSKELIRMQSDEILGYRQQLLGHLQELSEKARSIESQIQNV